MGEGSCVALPMRATARCECFVADRERGILIARIHRRRRALRLPDACWRRLTSGARNYLLGKTFHVRHVSIGSGAFLRGLSQVQLGENFHAGNGLWLQALNADGETSLAPKIIIGANFSVAFWCHIAALNRIVIGSDVMVGSKVTIIDHNHGCL